MCEQPALVVLISEGNVSRGKWPRGPVERLIRGKDGPFRTITIKAQKGRLSRPVQRLHSLEATTTQFVTDESGGEETSYGETSSKPPRMVAQKVKIPNVCMHERL